MTISRRVISQWLDLSSIKDEEIVKALNHLGFEVEQVKNLTFSNANLVVGEILRISKHPKSVKLNICEVNVGSKKNSTIICCANNIAVGNKVVVAQIGSMLANGVTITSITIQDVVSSGMICSLTELGIFGNVQSKDEMSGIIHLPSESIIGDKNPLRYLKLDDTVFFVDLTINRSDCLGIYSLARELSAYFKIPLKKMAINNLLLSEKSQVSILNTKIKALATLKINLKQNVTKLTPMWIKRFLQLANIPTKTLIEDIVNLVMLELGQPMIAFNGDLLKKPTFNISPKSYPEGSLKIKEGDIVIHDKFLAFSVLGLSYNIDYEVKDNTKNIFIFSINPDTKAMFEQVKRHNIVINNIFLERLVKPIVPDYYLIALQRYLFILDQLKIEYEVVEFSNDVPYSAKPKIIMLNSNDINKILGTNLENHNIIIHLNAIGCKVEIDANNRDWLKVFVPNHRNDLINSNDLSEEIARIIGYDNLPIVMPEVFTMQKPQIDLEILMENLRNHLISYGFNQVKTYSLTSQEYLMEFNFFKYKNAIKLSSPLTSTREVMRFNLTDSLLNICQYNYARKKTQLKIFTDETVYTNDDGEDNHHLGLVIMDDFWPNSNISKANVNPYYVAKGFIDGFFNKIIANVAQNIIYKPLKNSSMHPYLSANVFYEQDHIATLGALHPQTEKVLNIEKIFLVEINCTKLAKIIAETQKNTTKFKLWSKFNPLSRNISVIVKNDINFFVIKQSLLEEKIQFLEEIILIDFYIDDNLKSQFKHSLTFNLRFNSNEHQLDEEKIKNSMTVAQELLKSKFSSIIR